MFLFIMFISSNGYRTKPFIYQVIIFIKSWWLFVIQVIDRLIAGKGKAVETPWKVFLMLLAQILKSSWASAEFCDHQWSLGGTLWSYKLLTLHCYFCDGYFCYHPSRKISVCHQAWTACWWFEFLAFHLTKIDFMFKFPNHEFRTNTRPFIPTYLFT